MADGALSGEPQPGLSHRRSAIDGVAKQAFLVDRTAFACRDIGPAEAGRRLLVASGGREQVAGELLDRELVEWQVVVESFDDPITVGPQLPFVVEMEAMRVAVAGHVEPMTGHLLAVPRAGEKPVHEFLVGVGSRIGEKRIHVGRRRGQAGEREAQTSNQGGPVGGRVDRQTLDSQRPSEKGIDGVGGTGMSDGVSDRIYNRISDRWNRRLHERPKRPVLLVWGSRDDPPLQQEFLLLREHFAGMGRGHHRVGIGGPNPLEQFAGIGLPGTIARRPLSSDMLAPSAVSSRSPASCFPGPWQLRQFSARIGRMW